MTATHPLTQRAFNRAAKSYDTHCELQETVGERLLQFVTRYLDSARTIIDLGCGTGKVTEKFALRLHYQHFHAIDIADQSLLAARERLTLLKVNVALSDFNQLPCTDQPYDLMISNMALHWSNQLFTTLQCLSASLAKNGVLAFTVPLPGTFQQLSNQFALNSFIDSNSLTQCLTSLGHDVLFHEQETRTLNFADTLSALRSIKQVGANSVLQQKANHLRGKSFLQFKEVKELTYVVGYFIVRKTMETMNP